MNYRPPGGDPAGRGRTPRAGQRVPPANAGRVVGGRSGGHERDRRTSDARWQPNPAPPPRPSRDRTTAAPQSSLLTGGKTLLVILSVAVLAVTGYYWREVENLTDGMTTADVIDQPPQEKPADGAIDILMVGMDSRTDAQGQPLSEEQLAMLRTGEEGGVLNTDTLIMLRIPNDGKKAYGISMPRDSYVDIPGYGEHKINSAYLRARNEAMEQLQQEGVSDQAELNVRANQEGAKNIISTVQKLTGATIDHYAEVNLLGFYDITNAIGGIDVCLKEPVDEYRSGANFAAGQQTIAGADALAFVRQRHDLPNGDLDRIVRQQVFMNGMAKKVLSKDMLAPGSDTLENLGAAIRKSVVLDKDWNIIEFAQQMMNFTGGSIEFKTIPVGSIGLETPEDGSAVEVDPAEVQSFVAGLLDGGKPKDEADKPQDDASGEAAAGDITVNVRNASEVSGLAKQVSSTLSDKGFQTGEIGNADYKDTTVVRHAAGEKDKGDAVAGALGGNVVVEEDPNLSSGTVTVLLGGDFDESTGSADGGRLTSDPMLGLSGAVHQQPPTDAGPDANGCVN